MDPAPSASCPRCQVPLDAQPLVRHCGRCKGSWIAEQVLHERVAEARGAQPGRTALTWRKEGRAALRCATCAEPMETLVVQGTPVDRCPRHGVWFDAGELAHVLAAVALVAAPLAAQASPGNEWRAGEVAEGGVELALESAEVAAAAGEVGGGVFEVVVDGVGFVAEAVVEVIAGIFS
ncbi:MAG TPA: zf-TFIIB domain-containing protein [Kofleriaceae bacterium]|nr:zf-TFIIB domain-containing protein [Kofleriaceae bacterium]